MKRKNGEASIIGLGTAVPAYRIDQDDVASRLAEALENYPDSARWARRIFRQGDVDTRFTCDPNLLEPASTCRYMPSGESKTTPGTSERMALYRRESVPLGVQAALKALADACTSASEVTHLLTVSCTGQFLPGLDAELVRRLGLSARVQRIPLTFLGCAAGLRAIRLAQELAGGDEHARVLIVCVELCTLHFQPTEERDSLYPASFFGDGAAACVVSASEVDRVGVLRLGEGESVLIKESSGEEMVWEVGDHGFDLFLSTDIPKLLAEYLPAELGQLLHNKELPALWAIHPGGKAIIDTVQRLYGLSDEQTSFSRNVLRRCGNMSSATILFVLQAIRAEMIGSGAGEEQGIALAFGPGLTVEMMRFEYCRTPRMMESFAYDDASV
ncbi:type III polyketide synthase [Paenibacillaceae bacterium]|nr:type III polyketide synthase [Paenibacillaceae bacterium]